ncbi:MAG: CRISPR-associated protein Cas4 [Firmicutes bacterium HGW-Firmicutes-13]|nr:MAG: CRISPR-associated protein Cas4 [Firmicutes bacterium HGW-Firmicutes-13]
MFPLRVSDIKQYIYCPRILYFYYVLPVPRRVTRKMEYGKLEHIEIRGLEKRRKLKSYGLSGGARNFHVPLKSGRLSLHGILDMLIISDSGDYFPVEFKHSISKQGLHQKYQLAAYAMLLQEQLRKPVRYGFIYLIPINTAVPVEITQSMREHVKKVLSAIRNVIKAEKIPEYVRSKGRCSDCEFKNYCADIG